MNHSTTTHNKRGSWNCIINERKNQSGANTVFTFWLVSVKISYYSQGCGNWYANKVILVLGNVLKITYAATIQIFAVMSDNFQWVNSTFATNKAICENLICNIFSKPKQCFYLPVLGHRAFTAIPSSLNSSAMPRTHMDIPYLDMV